MIWRRFVLAAAGLLSCVVASAAEFRTQLDGGGQDITLFGPRLAAVPGAQIDVPRGAAAAIEPFTGTLIFSETRLGATVPAIEVEVQLTKNPLFFPAFRLRFSTVGSDLIPATQEIIRVGSLPGDAGYWDVQVGRGKVWSEPADGGWSRGAFPFLLVSPAGDSTHQGRATFLYRGGEVGVTTYQIFPSTNEDGRKSLAAAGALTPRLEREIFEPTDKSVVD
ncbi:hypothetical protein JYU29_17100 [Tianweitania sp. BSSL-BM11]|uniref:Uncharacterized protein n=1 Tax=Tianweitania aestuarii TaxID=2814886 RepID=A0ABS5RZF5_9HYPH|nr:hypothetical protein [Tianweitania aestuarii]MBS9722413.1 hypothetical protein [Tianweitania aestuarii]